jgi:hypothetical protein
MAPPPTLFLYASLGLIFVTIILVGVANALTVFEYGFGNSKASVQIWSSCFIASDGTEVCISVTSNRQCSELSSRMKAVGAFSIITILSLIICGVTFFFEGAKRQSFPVTHLTKILSGWALFGIAVDLGVVIGTYVAKLCSNPLSIKDQNGAFGPAFFLIFASFITACFGIGLYGYFMSKNVDSNDDEDAPDDNSKAFNTNDL